MTSSGKGAVGRHVRVKVDHLACRRSGRLIFQDLSFSLGVGEALVVTGRNGAGKSTLLALLAGRLRPDRGTIEAEGLGDAPLAEHLHWVAHRDALKPPLTAEENLAFARDVLGGPAHSTTRDPARRTDVDSPFRSDALSPRDALAALGLAHAAALPVAYLSAGQRRRVALARLLVAPRPLWLLDEPTSALDAASQDTLLSLMQQHLSEGGLIVAATHAPLGLRASEIRIERAALSDPAADD